MTEEREKLPTSFMMNEFAEQQNITLNKLNKKGGAKMMMPMQQPQESSWKDIIEQLKIQIANSEKTLLLSKAQLEEAESHIKEPIEEE